MKKILSIIIPSYNMENYIAACCSSLLVSPSFLSKIEVLIINDGSKDNTSIIAHSFQEKYPETFIVIDKINGNYGSCINAGLKIAHGKYVKVLDADDTFYTNNFEEYISLLENTDADLIISDFDEVDPDGKVFWSLKYPFPTKIENSIDSFSCNIIPYFSMHAVSYKIENIKRLDYFQSEGISYTDQEWIFLPMANIKTFIYFNKPVYRYLVGRNGQTVSPEAHAKNIWMEIKVVKKIINDYLTHLDIINDANITYIEQKLLERCTTIYHYYLIDFTKYVSLSELKEFDDLIKNKLNKIYVLLENNKDLLSFNYITSYRKKYSNNTFSFKFFYLYRKIYLFLNSKLHK
ncbi:Glycosyl transferase family 2 [Treponema bryantii]|uniref:Glycosyl transferase family 2 n=1 Tax=Treponema bryantii TaxID=163 RepID=A0A1H9J3Z1_9SPIR|nr:glycosyltransferase [Treponema bryantii]SEQ81508.1 Glycosyl transferase family 2 [Treponema bryantii]